MLNRNLADVTTRLSKLLNAHLGIELENYTEMQGLDIDPDLIIHLHNARAGETEAVLLTERPGLNETDFEMIKELVRSFLEGMLEGDHELADLEQVSSHLESLRLNDKIDQSNDVVRLDHFRKNPFPFIWNNKADDDFEIDDLLNPPLRAELMFGPEETVYRQAFDNHISAGRFAFVRMSDLNPDVWDDVVAIRRLGNLTLFIQDITALTFAEQDKMLEILSAPASEDDPHFIFAANSTLPELRRSHKVREKFLALLCPTQKGVSSQTDHFLSP